MSPAGPASEVRSVGGSRTVLIGCGPTAGAALRSLIGTVDVIGLIRVPEGDQDWVCNLAERNGIAVHPARSRRDVERLIACIRPDCVVISSFNRVLGAEVLSICPFFNVHYAILPRYRGNAPVNWALLNGDPRTAITIHRVEPRLDAGSVLYQEAVPIRANDTATSLFDRLNAIQERQLGSTVARALTGWSGIVQDSSRASYGCARNPEDGEIDWYRPAREIDRLVRALTPPFPGAFTHYDGVPLVVHRTSVVPHSRQFEGRIPGRVVEVSSAQGWIEVLAGAGVVRVLEMSRAGEPSRPAAQLVRSQRARLGLSRLDLLHRLSALEQRLALLEARNNSSTRNIRNHG